MRGLISYFIKNELLVNLGIVLVVLMGLVAVTNMNSSFFPNPDENTIIIEAIYPGASPREIEEGIVLKIEENLKSVSGIDRITSTSSENTANINIELQLGQDADLVLQDVKNAVDQISNFPADMEQLVVYVRENVNFTAKVALVGDVDLSTLKDKAEELEDELRTLPNISKIQIQGYTQPEIEIEVDETSLRTYNLTFAELAFALQNENLQVTGGTIKGKSEVIIRADQKKYRADELLNIPIKTLSDGNPLLLRQVSDIREDWSENTNKAYYNGQNAVIVVVNTLNEENILDAAESIKALVPEFNKRNSVVEAILVNDGTETLNERIELLQNNGLMGSVLVLVLLGLFLRVRMAFWVALGIPISFLGMFVIANLYGITINVLSLFGMIIVVGILVDDGIVVGENVFQHYEKGKTKWRAVIDGTLEVIPAILSAITTTCLAFSFFFFIDGRLGEFFSDVAFVVIAALGFSLIEVIFFLPAHLAHSKDLSEFRQPNKIKVFVENLLIRYRDVVFKPSIAFVLKYKVFAFLTLISIFLITLGSIQGGYVKTTFFPNIERQEVQVTLEFPSGTADYVVESEMKKIEQSIFNLDKKYQEELGQQIITDSELIFGPRSNQASGTFYLVSSESREIRSFKIATDMREAVGHVPEAEQLSFETQTPFGKPLNVSFSGENFIRLRQAVNDFKAAALKTNMVKDLVTNDRADMPEINVNLNDKGRALGFTNRDVIQQIRYGFFGFEAQRLQRGDDEVKVWVRYAMEDRDDLENLKKMRIRSAMGELVPVSEIADLEQTNGLLAINHLDGKRQIKVEGELASFDISSTEMISKIASDILPVLQQRYPDIKIQLDGQQRQNAKLFASIKTTGPVILILLVSILVITFRSVSQSVSLLMIIPFGIIGAAFGHWVHDLPMSLLSFLGFIGLLGVIVNDGLVYVGAININLKEGMKYDEALMEAALSRFRPIFLTTVTTCAGLAPIIFEKSFQAQFLVPMAITIAYGLLFGSIILMLMLPIFLSTFNRAKVWLSWLATGKKPSHEEVEKAVIRQQNNKKYDEV